MKGLMYLNNIRKMHFVKIFGFLALFEWILQNPQKRAWPALPTG